jgi:hypothetical protein
MSKVAARDSNLWPNPLGSTGPAFGRPVASNVRRLGIVFFAHRFFASHLDSVEHCEPVG